MQLTSVGSSKRSKFLMLSKSTQQALQSVYRAQPRQAEGSGKQEQYKAATLLLADMIDGNHQPSYRVSIMLHQHSTTVCSSGYAQLAIGRAGAKEMSSAMGWQQRWSS